MNSDKSRATPFAQTYFHGTKADLRIGDLIEVHEGSTLVVVANALRLLAYRDPSV